MPNYEVADTKQVQTLKGSGKPKTMFRVWIETERGATGILDVLPSQWNAQDLPALLQAKADQLDLAFDIAPSL